MKNAKDKPTPIESPAETSAKDTPPPTSGDPTTNTAQSSASPPSATEASTKTTTLPNGVGAVRPVLSAADRLNLEALRLPQNFAATAGLKKVITAVPVRKPDKQAFIRVRPGEEYRLQTAVLEHEREHYLVDPALWQQVEREVRPMVLFTAITRAGDLFLWPVKLPTEDGRADTWNSSALEAAQMATTKWVRVKANMQLGAYDVYTSQAELSDPEWPDLTFQELVEKAFRDRFIKSMDHPVLKRLRGEV